MPQATRLPPRQYHPEEHSPISRQRVETPPPAGFRYNRGVHYIPFQIRDAQEKLHPARYTQLVFTADPFVLAYRRGSDQQYGKSVHASPDYDCPVTPTYTDDDLVCLDQDSSIRGSINRALLGMKDLTLTAEVHRYRCLQAGYIAKEIELLKKIEELDTPSAANASTDCSAQTPSTASRRSGTPIVRE